MNLLKKRMNHLKIKVYKTVLKEVSENYKGAEEFINIRIVKISSQEKLSADTVIYFLCFHVSFLAVSWHKSIRNL